MLNYYETQTELKLWKVVSFLCVGCLLLAVVLFFVKDFQINAYQNETIACRNENQQIKANAEKIVNACNGEKPDVEIMLIPSKLETN